MTTAKELTYLNLAEWGLSPQAVAILSREPDILSDLAQDRLRPPFPPGYIPTLVVVLFDDIPYIRSQQGVVTYLRDCRQDYHPAFVEYRFDDEIAVFHVDGEYVVNRIEGVAQVTALQALLN